MVKAWIANVENDDTGRKRIHAALQWGGQENLNPKDVGLQTIDSIVLSNQNITTTNQPLPIGSVGNKFGAAFGSPGPYGYLRGEGPGSTITLRWIQGSTGTRLAVAQNIGTRSPGTKTAHAVLLGT